MMRHLYIVTLCAMLLAGEALHAQVVDTVDFMKEFNERSFADAGKVAKVRDSTKLREHLVGVKIGYAMNNVHFSQEFDRKALTSMKNFGLYYTYYHSLWNSISLFGIETGIQYNEEGYISLVYDAPPTIKDRKATEGKERFQEITIPFVSQFRIDFWKMRLLANAGAFGSYKLSASFSPNIADTISTTYRKAGYGFIFGAGLAVVFRPVEVHFEFNWKYNLSNLYSQKAFYDNVWVSTHTTQMIFSVGVFYRIGGSSYIDPANKPSRKKRRVAEDIELQL